MYSVFRICLPGVFTAAAIAQSVVYAPLNESPIAAFDLKSGAHSIVAVASSDASALFVAPSGKTCFVATMAGSLNAFNSDSGRKIAHYNTTYPVVATPSNRAAFALSSDESQLFVGTCAHSVMGICQGGFVESFSVLSGKQLGAVSFGSDQIVALAVTPDGMTLYVSHDFNPVLCCSDAPVSAGTIPPNSLTAVSIPSFTVGKSSTLSPPPLQFVIDPSGRAAYFITSAASGFQLITLSLPRMMVTGMIPLGGPGPIGISADGTILCVNQALNGIGAANYALGS